MSARLKFPGTICFGVSVLLSISGMCHGQGFIGFERALPVIDVYRSDLPPELKGKDSQTLAAVWPVWVKEQDRRIRLRLDRGEEDTLTNWLRFGVSYTKKPRIDWQSLFQYGQNAQVDALAQGRADDLTRALAHPGNSDRLLSARNFLKKQRYSLSTPAGRAGVKKYLLQNLARMRDEYQGYRAELQELQKRNPGEKDYMILDSHLYAKRGISLDTNVLPDYSIDSTLQLMARKGMIAANSIRRVAILGPGLDFANKEEGSDFYPLQMTQPFAVMDSLLKLQLADRAGLEVVTYDISPSVNHHLMHIRANAAGGKPYVVQLPLDTDMSPVPDFSAYWKGFGTAIGKAVDPVQVPEATPELRLRALSITPQSVRRVFPVDMNVVFQSATLSPAQQFDLVIGTNIFVYYGAFEQALALANLSRMIASQGYLLSNNLLADRASNTLKFAFRNQVPYSTTGKSETIFAYQKH